LLVGAVVVEIKLIPPVPVAAVPEDIEKVL
jgi:hypothetical protein